MQIAIASGKGGTGKTTVATNLAYVSAASGILTSYLDCDVEEPNGHLFLNPEIEMRRDVFQMKPEVDAGKCTHCGLCEQICQFNAIVSLENDVLLFSELCHSCGGCELVCPSGAIKDKPNVIGSMDIGKSGKLAFVSGLLNIGEAMSPPVIREVKSQYRDVELRIIDSPPGTTCPVIESVKDSEYVVLVTEPTPFGLNDLALAVELIKKLEIPFGVVVNRAGENMDETKRFCERLGADILAEFPEDRRVAESYSRGELISRVDEKNGRDFLRLLKTIVKEAGKDS